MDNIVLFDGICNLCNGAVQFIIKRDPKGKFKFAPLQSEIRQKLLGDLKMSTQQFDTIVLIKNEKVYTKSSAALLIAKELKGVWKLAYIFIALPKPVRDFFYMLIARHRYKIFGKRDSCMVPTAKLKKRFITEWDYPTPTLKS